MKHLFCSAMAVFALLSSGIAAAQTAPGAPRWVAGKNYFLVQPPRPTDLPKGKVEVTEVFSYACPACNAFLPTMEKLKASLPPNAVLDYLPAAFNTAEDWPVFQQGYCTAQVLGVAEATHVAMFDAVWGSGELAVSDPATGRLKQHMPTIEDLARFYQQHAAVPAAKFVATAKSFQVDSLVRRANDLVAAYAVDRTPTLIVNGKYRVNTESAGGPDQVIELVRWLVSQESR